MSSEKTKFGDNVSLNLNVEFIGIDVVKLPFTVKLNVLSEYETTTYICGSRSSTSTYPYFEVPDI